MRYLALCCIAKDEDASLREWICYHSLLGVEHFIIYDNFSAYPIRHRLKEFGAQKNITLLVLPGQAMQMQAYQHCLDNFGEQFKWIGFLDLDEFVCLKKDDDLRVFLSEYENYAGLALNWRLFGSNVHIQKPAGPVIANYTQAYPEKAQIHLHVKSFVQPARTFSVSRPHNFLYKPGEFCVNARHRPLPSDTPFSQPEYGSAWINHYYFKSQQDWEEKLLRGRSDTALESLRRQYGDFYIQFAEPWQDETTILRRLPELSRALAEPALPLADSPCGPAEEWPALMDKAVELAGEKELDKAQICLNYAAMLHASSAEMWILRAKLARLRGLPDRAETFICQALRYEEMPRSYEELFYIHLARDQKAEAADLLDFLQTLLLCREVGKDEAWRKKIEAMRAMLG